MHAKVQEAADEATKENGYAGRVHRDLDETAVANLQKGGTHRW